MRRRLSILSTLSVGLLLTAGLAAALAQPAAARPSRPGGGTSQPSCGTVVPVKPDGSRYVCSFSDDFSGRSLDTGKWLVQATSYSGMTSGQNCYVNDPRLVFVRDGRLRLTSKIEPSTFTCANPYGDFTTTQKATSVTTRGRFSQAFGRFTFRAKFTDTTASGLHAALWLYPSRLTYGGWPHSGEIDVAEWFSRSSGHVFPSVHYSGYAGPTASERACPVAGAGSSYHVYEVEWLATTMRFFYDGALCFEHAWTPDAPLTGSQPFDQPFNVVMTQAMGQGWNWVDAATPTTGTLDVDWVRVWK